MTTRRERAQAARTMRQTMDATARARAAEVQAREARRGEAQMRAELREVQRRDDRILKIEFLLRDEGRLGGCVLEAYAGQQAVSRVIPWNQEGGLADAVMDASYKLIGCGDAVRGVVHALRSSYQRPRYREWDDR